MYPLSEVQQRSAEGHFSNLSKQSSKIYPRLIPIYIYRKHQRPRINKNKPEPKPYSLGGGQAKYIRICVYRYTRRGGYEVPANPEYYALRRGSAGCGKGGGYNALPGKTLSCIRKRERNGGSKGTGEGGRGGVGIHVYAYMTHTCMRPMRYADDG